MSYHGTSLLPTGTRANPMTREGEYMEPDQTLYVLQRVGSNGYTVASSYGSFATWTVGSVHACYHDQTGAQFGAGQRVVGIVRPGLPNEGMVPSKKLPLRVFK